MPPTTAAARSATHQAARGPSRVKGRASLGRSDVSAASGSLLASATTDWRECRWRRRRRRRGATARTTQRTMATAEMTRATSTSRWGVQVSTTDTEPSRIARPSVAGSTRHPLAKPSTRVGAPRLEPPPTVAFQPRLMLCPRTRSKSGDDVLRPETVSWMLVDDWDVTRTVGAGATGGGARTPGPARGMAPPPAAESMANWSMSKPVVDPATLSRVWVPGPRASPPASGPHRETESAWRSRAAAVDPDTCVHTGRPSTASRSSRHDEGMVAGTGAATSPGIPTSAMPMGMAMGERE